MKCILTFVLLLTVIQLNAQPFDYFNKRLDLSETGQMDRMSSVISDTGGFLIIGYTYNDVTSKILLSKISEIGQKEWVKTIGNSNSEEFPGFPGCLIRYNDSLIYSAGPTKFWENDTSWVGGRLICYNNALDTLWTRLLIDKGIHDTSYFIYNFIKTISGDFVFTGGEYTDPFPSHVLLHKSDKLGNIIWRKSYGYTGNDYYMGYSVMQTTDGGYAIGGHKYAPGEFGDPLVIKTDSLGNQEWMLNFGGQYQDNKAMVCPAHDGTIICGTALATSMVNPDLAKGKINIIKIDNTGNVLWNRLYGADRMDNFLLNIRPTPDGGYIASGQVISTVPYWVGWLFKIDENGDSLWYREYNFLFQEDVYQQLDDVIPTSDNGFFGAGYVNDVFVSNDMDAWVLKVDSLGCEAPGQCWVGINKPAPPEPANVCGISLQPNPATTETWVSWQGEASWLEVFNASGVRVWQCKLPPEQTQYRLNTQAWPHGLYLLRLFMKEGHAITTKMMKL
jgi:hypothetical protein